MSAGWIPPVTNPGPKPPNNPMAFDTLGQQGSVDLRWDDPSLLAFNMPFIVAGVNIYRSDVSDRGPYYRINEIPIGGGFYRDRTQVEYVDREPVLWESSWELQGDGPNNRAWVLRTQYPIVKNDHRGNFDKIVFANSPYDVVLYINGVECPVDSVFGRNGQVRLINLPSVDVRTERLVPPNLPTENDQVEISYYRQKNFIRKGLDAKTFYRVTTVAYSDVEASGFIETPLAFAEPVNKFQVEVVDWVWRAAVQRNHWILQQGGERVKVFTRKTCGMPCKCQLDDRQLEYIQQPLNNCTICFGTGFVGGYEGPFDIIIAPDDAESRIAQTSRGQHKEKTQDVWMTATPIVTMRDFIVKQTGERFSIGAVRRPTARGAILQQHYSIGYLDEDDIRYAVPIDGTDDLIRPAHQPHTRYAQWPIPPQPEDQDTGYFGNGKRVTEAPFPAGPEDRWPQVTEKENINDEREGRGRTPVWENITYIWPILLIPILEILIRSVKA